MTFAAAFIFTAYWVFQFLVQMTKFSRLGILIATAVAGLLAGGLTLWLVKVGLFVLGAAGGLALAMGVLVLDDGQLFGSHDEYRWPFVVSCCVVGGLLTLLLQKRVLLVFTAVLGGFLLILGLDRFLQTGVLRVLEKTVGIYRHTTACTQNCWILLGTWLVTSILGIIVQHRLLVGPSQSSNRDTPLLTEDEKRALREYSRKPTKSTERLKQTKECLFLSRAPSVPPETSVQVVSPTDAEPLLGRPISEPLFARLTRSSPGKLSVIGGTLVNVIGIIGPGILALPSALRDGGWLAPLTIVVCDYTATKLSACLDEMRARKGITADSASSSSMLYGAIGRVVGEGTWGSTGGRILEVFVWLVQYGTLIGVAAIFFILMGGIVETIAEEEGESWDMINITLVIMAGLCLLLLFPSFDTLANLTTLTFVTTALAVAIILFYLPIRDGFSSKTELIASDFGLAFSSIIFSMGNHAMFLEVRESTHGMPQNTGILFRSTYAIILMLYVPVAAIGYAVYGPDTESPILDNLPYNWLTTLINITFLFNVLISYPLVLQPVLLDSLSSTCECASIVSQPIYSVCSAAFSRGFLRYLLATLAPQSPTSPL
eukprot:TRINITY_DN3551_c0_g1_i5.p1 TRINITY_DN3551_c0_g1~~TRINITY_DN3551_c0_g1_i5.p1  ORF type:complete len:634 (-),score=101.42 TRINITY_DN3551_c0_g1_i5:190-1992(-)